jgi:glucose-6-phosphate isomerase
VSSRPLTATPAWQALTEHAARLKSSSLRSLFAADTERAHRFSVEAAGVFLDYSKNRIDAQAFAALVALAEEAGLRERTERMFTGERINVTEGRAVLHTAVANCDYGAALPDQ